MDAKSLDRNSPVPLYVQIEDFIRHEIATGSWKPGERIPSEAALNAALGVSRMTVRGVLNGLVSDGLLQRVPGKGTFVTHQKIATTTELVSIRRTIPGKAIRDGLGIAPSTPVHEVVRRRSVDSHPVSLHRSFVPVHLAPELEHDDVLGEQLCVILENKYGLHSSYTGEQLEAVAATKEEADLLGLRPGAPLLLLQDTISEASGRVFEFSKILFRGDRIKLHFDYRS